MSEVLSLPISSEPGHKEVRKLSLEYQQRWNYLYHKCVAENHGKLPESCEKCQGFDKRICLCALENYLQTITKPKNREVTSLIREMFDDHTRGMMMIAMCCNVCGGGYSATCRCALQSFANSLTDAEIESYKKERDAYWGKLLRNTKVT